MTTPALELRGAARRFGDGAGIGPVDLAVARGETVALIGESGSGKSTLLRLVLGLARPDAGEVRFAGGPVRPDDDALRRRIGYVIQGGALFPHLTGAENATLVARHLRWEPARAARRLRELEELVQLPPGAREHLALVGIALLAAIGCALPLGIATVRRPALGRVILGAVGVVQTVPALALLVFMIPLLGIGAAPAIAALFLYALLPIVRNVHAGLTGIPPEIRDAARALGMPAAARLRRVELPLAAPAILAGVRTSAVITVGGATLGALVGAGGYGQPILAGVRLASVPLILEGAVPAALLALAVERAFGLAERILVSPGLRAARR